LINDNFKDIGNEFGQFIIEIYLETLTKANLSDNMVKLIVWVIGEIGSQTCTLFYWKLDENDTQKLNELTLAIIRVLDNVFEDYLTISWAVTALAKL